MNAPASILSPTYAKDGDADLLAARFSALSHPARVEILKHLANQGACCCGEVVSRLDLAQSTVSQHLKILVDAGLVTFAPDRQRSRYEIDGLALADLSRSVTSLAMSCCEPREPDTGNRVSENTLP